MKKELIKYKWLVVLILVIGIYIIYTPSLPGSDAVVEIDGVLFFPDGIPVRNYEQLHIYENSR